MSYPVPTGEFDDYFVTSFKQLLATHYYQPKDLSVSWAECEEAMRRYAHARVSI